MVSTTDGPALLPEPVAVRLGRSTRAVTWLFAVTAFVGASLLFVVQPLVAKLLLPSYGGSATVWSTSSLFFQVVLLVAYLYAHLTTTRLGPRWQPRAHLVLLALPLLALPVAVPAHAAPDPGSSPVLWLLRTLVLLIGLPFAVVATTGPLLQRWYSWGDGARADDPYFLFAASNLGSFGGLLAYPFIIEPTMSLGAQRTAWTVGFAVFLLLTATCALTVRGRAEVPVDRVRPVATAVSPRPGRRQVGVWMLLAFLPSSLMLGVTAHISTDIAAIPLLWVVPLALYLATFVVAFARSTREPPRRATMLAVVAAVVTLLSTFGALQQMILPAVLLNLVTLTLVAFAAHARLAAERPAPEHLTGFFLVVATGGALGGLLNGMVAPTVFDRVLEYPVALACVPLLLLGATRRPEGTEDRVRTVLVLLAVVLAPAVVFTGERKVPGGTAWNVLLLLLLGAAVVWLARRPAALAAGLVLVVVLSALGQLGVVVLHSRTFYGTYRVEVAGDVAVLVHGTTTHGMQDRAPGRSTEPTAYYSRQGPLGDAFATTRPTTVGAVGLGAGTIAAYGEPGQVMTFFELDPEIVRIASDPRYFTYIEQSKADVHMVVGDGRLSLARTPDHSFDMLVLDAFSSDSIPLHLLTEEAMQMYGERLAPDGLMMVHISNNLFDLEPVLAAAADDLGWSAAVRHASPPDGLPSTWVAMSRDPEALERLTSRSGWEPLGDREVRWTDDYSSVLPALK